VGVGLRWILPIGPVRFDLGVNPDPEEGEDTYVLHFSLGTAY
jgi:outer membrane protein insertion porin family